MNENFLITFHKPELIKIIEAEDTKAHYSISVNFIVLFEQHPTIAQKLLGDEPEQYLGEFENACVKAQLLVLKDSHLNSQIKSNIHCRFFQLPGLPAIRKSVLPGNLDVGKFLQISGTVMRVTAPKVLEYQRRFVCAKCKTPILESADYERMYAITQPKTCLNPDCSGTNFVSMGNLDPENCKDYQEIKIQEQLKDGGTGTMPATMWITLEDDIVDLCTPGDNVTVCGILKRRWNDFYKGKKLEMELVLKANSIQVDNTLNSANLSIPESQKIFEMFWEKYSSNPLDGRDVILRSFCPEIYGLYLVKLAVTVILAGGTPTDEPTDVGIRTRADSHILLVGDPGTGKSNMLHFASKVIPRSVLTTGVGSTAAGLTVTAIMEHGEWQLEAGALVMSDGGICCIDEFSSMKEHDRTSIHEAMEQQSISVAKASIVCKLNTRCSILAACNFKVSPQNDLPLNTIINLPSPLLSRFDLIMLLNDRVSDNWDKEVVDYILNGGSRVSKLSDVAAWSIEMLQAYFLKIKKLKPKLTEDTEAILNSYYQMQRRTQKRNKARTTIRLLESLVRLSQGHAKLMLHEKVEVMDAIYAITLVDAAMDEEACILKLDLTSNSNFPESATEDYRNLLAIILGRLQLPEILRKEERNIRQTNIGRVQSRFFGDHLKGQDENINIFNHPTSHDSNSINDMIETEPSNVSRSYNPEFREKKTTLENFDSDEPLPVEILEFGESSEKDVNIDNVDSTLKTTELNKSLKSVTKLCEAETIIVNSNADSINDMIETPASYVSRTCNPEFRDRKRTLENFDTDEHLPVEMSELGESSEHDLNRDILDSRLKKTQPNKSLKSITKLCKEETIIVNSYARKQHSQEQSQNEEITKEDPGLKDVLVNKLNGSHYNIHSVSKSAVDRITPTIATNNTETYALSDRKKEVCKRRLEKFKFVRKPKDLEVQEQQDSKKSYESCMSTTNVSKKPRTEDVQNKSYTQVSHRALKGENSSEELLRSQFDTEEDVDLNL